MLNNELNRMLYVPVEAVAEFQELAKAFNYLNKSLMYCLSKEACNLTYVVSSLIHY